MDGVLGTGPITRELLRQTHSMTVSSSSAAAAALRNTVTAGTTSTATTSAAITAVAAAIADAQPTLTALGCSSARDGAKPPHMRTFAVIICNDCLYLEFPGCDVHGVLYTDRVLSTESSKDKDSGNRSRLHAKCPECTAATNNVRPFRDGCRRCKGATTVCMWASTLDEIAQAHDAFPAHTEEIEHTALVCDSCQSVVFPRAREVLTRRALDEPLTTLHGKPLKVSNFQLSMPHVDGCSRKGMPVTTVPIQLPKSELKFVHDRIEKCPIAQRIQGGLQYRKRHAEVLTQQNHLHQIYLRLLSSIVKAFDAKSPSAIEPLQTVLAMFAKMEPLALFADWSPPRQLSSVTVTPTRVLSSSDFDKAHGAHRILETGGSFWRSALPSPQRPYDEWLTIQFNAGVTLSAITLSWHPDFVPTRFVLGVSADGTSFETVAIVVDGAAETRVAFAKHQDRAVSAIKLTLLSTKSSSKTFGLQSITCHEAMYAQLYTPSDALLRNLQDWLLDASMSPCQEVRELALQALEHLALASGSLCGLLHLAAGLLLNAAPSSVSARPLPPSRVSESDWSRIDILSDTAQQSAGRFLRQLSLSIQDLVKDKECSPPIAGAAAPGSEIHLLDQRILQGMPAFLRGGVSSSPAGDTTQRQSAVHPLTEPSIGQHAPSSRASGGDSDDELSATERDDGVRPFMTLCVLQPAFVRCIKRRSQLGMIVLCIVSELSAWQMQRMQRAEEFAGKREEELMQLEEPFSIEIRPEFFDLAHRILSVVLAPWLAGRDATCSDARVAPREQTPLGIDSEEKSPEKEPVGLASSAAPPVDLYSLLQQSFAEMSADVVNESKTSDGALSRLPPAQDFEQVFSPDGLCVALLQTITSNIRRLVLSRVDPSEVGIEPVSGDFLSAPPALEPLVSSLEQLISLGAKRSDPFFAVSLKAAAAVEVGMEAFYPSAQQRTKLLTSRMGKGATLEVQVRWPVQERDQEDPRYERLILMLQFECIRLGLTHALRGSWHLFMHLIVQVPSIEHTEHVLTHHFASCIQRAGFSSWQVVAGAQEISINLQRHLHWNRVEKMSHDSGAGWIRVYPRDVAQYADVLADVEHFVAIHDKRDGAKRA